MGEYTRGIAFVLEGATEKVFYGCPGGCGKKTATQAEVVASNILAS